jgi:Peptidase inhibitor I9
MMIQQRVKTPALYNSRRRFMSIFNAPAIAFQAALLLFASDNRYPKFAVQARINAGHRLNEVGEDVHSLTNASKPIYLSNASSPSSIDQLLNKTDDDMVNVIIGFKAGSTSRMAEQPGLEVKYQYTRVNAQAVRMSRDDMLSLSENPDVQYVEEDADMYLDAEIVPWGIKAIQADVTTTPPPDTDNLRPGERCFRICIIDSGFYAGHTDLVRASCRP